MPSVKDAVVTAIGKERIGLIDDTIIDYILGVLDDESLRSNAEELDGVLSPFLTGAGLSEADSKEICNEITKNLSGGTATKKVESAKLISQLNIAQISLREEKSIEQTMDWAKSKESISIVDKDKLEAYESKRERRKEQRQKKEQTKKISKMDPLQQEFFVSRSTDKATGNKSKDVKLENFSISYGKNELLVDASATIAFGRRYCLVGRNGSGKTTLLKHMARREIQGIPGYLSILHVEQEVAGDETTVLQSVLRADQEREQLMEEERDLLDENDDNNSARLRKIHERLMEIEADTAESRASVILTGLGFTSEMQDKATKEYSGGWRMRIALARALFCRPDLLLLDEPTNHLDLFSVLWLEAYLLAWKGTLLIVSHQRDFINAVATDILHLKNKKVDHYKGDFDNFETVMYERALNQQKAFDAQQKKINHVQAFINRFRYNANRAALVQSRLKALAKMQLVDEIALDPTLVINFPDPDELTPPILQFYDVSFKYGNGEYLFQNLNIGIDMDSRVALLGSNGAGKSTLLKLMAGELEPTSGRVIRNGKLRFAKFSQHFVDQLGDYNVSPLEHFMDKNPGVLMQTARTHLGSFGLSGDLALRSIQTLSGGQKSRLVFAMLAWKKPHVLLLDEPTNHLDIETIDSLCQALGTFKGGVLLVSHDERLISIVCDQMWFLREKKITVMDGEFTDYKKFLMAQIAADSNLVIKK